MTPGFLLDLSSHELSRQYLSFDPRACFGISEAHLCFPSTGITGRPPNHPPGTDGDPILMVAWQAFHPLGKLWVFCYKVFWVAQAVSSGDFLALVFLMLVLQV